VVGGALPGPPAYLFFCVPNFGELRLGEVRAEGRADKARNWCERGNRTGGYSSTNSSTGTPYALAIFVMVGM
jgi:hypothetical protein